MNNKELLKMLQEKMAVYDLITLKEEYAQFASMKIAADDYDNMNKKFNLETLISLKENQGNFFYEEIDDRYITKFRDAINHFMEEHVPGDEPFKDYIRRLNCYRTFIQKIPMHPIGMSLEMGRVTRKGKDYYCSAKKVYMNQPNSLCKFCVAKLSEL